MNQRSFVVVLLLIAALLAGWMFYTSQQAVQAEPIQEVTAKYWNSGHADAASEAFVHWNEDEPAEIPVYCARCHSSSGFMDFVGADGSEAGKVDMAGKINDPINCTACHNDEAHALDAVTLPSGVEVTGTGANSVCMSCHGGMSAGTAVAAATEGKEEDTPMADSSLMGPHYFHAAAVHQGADAGAGYQYEGKTYVGAFEHAEPVSSCTECHDPHSLHTQKIPNSDASLCSTCHSDVSGFADYRKVSMSKVDYDGDGTVEPVFDEIEGVKAVLYDALNKYSQATTDNGFGFKFDSYPYAFIDTNKDGTIDESEGIFPNQFKLFTPRMQKAAFNYMFVQKEPAAYLHNAKYVLQLMFDSIEDLSSVSGVTTQGLTRP
ncbi:MAG: cytochrome c3 family protein [Anaerolineaceae bacterium]|nr:cytochrome c3 family protein [Anaerolineaceae bacterium]